MSNTGWFGAVLRFAIVDEDDGLWRHVMSVVLIYASDFDDAFVRALEVGRLKEECHVNSDGERVRCA